MKLRAIRLRSVRQFGAGGAAIENIADGVNVLAAPNEFGKSTVFDALRAVLFVRASSRSQEVVSLVPDPGGGAPEIEVDLDTERGRLRIAKRFMSGPRATLTDLARGATIANGGEVDDWIGRELDLQKAAEGRPGLLWLQQGTSLKDLGRIKDAPESLGELIDREVGDVTGGERLRALLDRARGELFQLVTRERGGPRKGGRLDRALQEHEAAQAMARRLEARAATAEQAIEALVETEAELASTASGEAEAALAGEVEEARRRLGAAEAAALRRGALAREHQAARAAEQRAKEALTALTDDQQAACANQRRLAEARAQLALAEAARTAAREAETAARLAYDQHRDKLRAAETATGRARAAVAAQAAVATLDDARERLGAAQNLAAERRDAANARALNGMTRARLDALARDVDAWRLAQARLDARRPTVTVFYDPAARARVRIDGQAIDAAVAQPIDRPTDLSLDGIGRLRIDPGDVAAAEHGERDAVAAEATVRARLGKLGVADLAEARSRLDAAEALDRALLDFDLRLARLAPEGVDALGARVAALEAERAGDVADAPDLAEAERCEAMARAAWEAAEELWRERIAAAAAAGETAADARARVDTLADRVEASVGRLGPESSWPTALETTRAKLDTAHAQAISAEAELAAAAAVPADVDAAAAELRRLDQALANHRARIQGYRERASELRGSLQAAAADGLGERLAEALSEQERWAADVAALEAEAEALRVLVEVLEASEARVRERFTEPVLAAMRPLLAQVLPDATLELTADLGPHALRRPGRADAFERLSGGTREQIAVLARLGFARLLAAGGRGLPVVLDDALVFSDDARIERMFTALTMAGDNVQVLVLTCRERSFRRLGGTMLQVVPWPASEG